MMAWELNRDAAQDAGLDPVRLQRAADMIESAVAQKMVPGAVALVGRGERTVLELAAGLAVDRPDWQLPMRLDTVFDLASLTKVCATLPAVLALLDRGQILLTDPVAAFIPQYGDGLKRKVTVRHLLTHSSGLPAGELLYQQPTREAARLRLLEVPLERAPGDRVVYSDIGFMLLGEIIERATGMFLQEYVGETVFKPLGMRTARYSPLQPQGDAFPVEQRGVSPGERVDAPDYAATEWMKDSGRLTYGTVHDENAYALGGVAGHAGMFAAARDVALYARMWAAGGALFAPATVRAAIRLQTERLDGFRGLGWCLRGDSYDHMGDLWPDGGFGHTGFTGTSIAIDPESGLWFVLLTNRVHYGRQNDPGRLRRLTHNAVAAALR